MFCMYEMDRKCSDVLLTEIPHIENGQALYYKTKKEIRDLDKEN